MDLIAEVIDSLSVLLDIPYWDVSTGEGSTTWTGQSEGGKGDLWMVTTTSKGGNGVRAIGEKFALAAFDLPTEEHMIRAAEKMYAAVHQIKQR